MNYIVVSISEMKVSNRSGDILVAYSLGSCLGITVYDPVAHVGGMIHCMLPVSRIDPEKAQQTPAMFVDTGVPALFQEAYRLGAKESRMIVKVAGGSRILDDDGTFKIGRRNYAVLRKVLWEHNVLIAAEDVGGSFPRTMYLEIDTGKVTVRGRGKRTEL
ncbi:chemotaxis protein CheD [Candidatus Poribacteria bacterium]